MVIGACLHSYCFVCTTFLDEHFLIRIEISNILCPASIAIPPAHSICTVHSAQCTLYPLYSAICMLSYSKRTNTDISILIIMFYMYTGCFRARHLVIIYMDDGQNEACATGQSRSTSNPARTFAAARQIVCLVCGGNSPASRPRPPCPHLAFPSY